MTQSVACDDIVLELESREKPTEGTVQLVILRSLRRTLVY